MYLQVNFRNTLKHLSYLIILGCLVSSCRNTEETSDSGEVLEASVISENQESQTIPNCTYYLQETAGVPINKTELILHVCDGQVRGKEMIWSHYGDTKEILRNLIMSELDLRGTVNGNKLSLTTRESQIVLNERNLEGRNYVVKYEDAGEWIWENNQLKNTKTGVVLKRTTEENMNTYKYKQLPYGVGLILH